MEDVKIKIGGLWIFKALASLTFSIIWFLEEGVLEGIMDGEFLGMEIGPELMLVGTIEAWVPLVMIVLSLNLKTKANRWTNIIVGIVFTALSLISMVDALTAHGILIWVSQAVATALIVWLAWKWPK
jgi:hypothetical protein